MNSSPESRKKKPAPSLAAFCLRDVTAVEMRGQPPTQMPAEVAFEEQGVEVVGSSSSSLCGRLNSMVLLLAQPQSQQADTARLKTHLLCTSFTKAM